MAICDRCNHNFVGVFEGMCAPCWRAVNPGRDLPAEASGQLRGKRPYRRRTEKQKLAAKERVKRRYARRRTPMEIQLEDIRVLERRERLADRRASRPERRRIKRDKKLPDPRVCPSCGLSRPKSKSWVCPPYSVTAVCLGCFRTKPELRASAPQASGGSR